MSLYNVYPWQDECPRVAISACLLGQQVRYDGRHKFHPDLVAVLAAFCELVPVCPEVELGLGVPRPPIQLHRRAEDAEIRLRVVPTGHDLTEAMQNYARRRAAELESAGIAGVVLKARSPSCGLGNVPIAGGETVRAGQGLFAEVLTRQLPWLPAEDEQHLRSADDQRMFLARVLAAHRAGRLPGDPAAIVELAEQETLLLEAHQPAARDRLRRLARQAASLRSEALGERWRAVVLGALSRRPSRRRHAGVMLSALARLRPHLRPAVRRAAADAIDHYQRGWAPWCEPLKMLAAAARLAPEAGLHRQTYFAVAPAER